MAIGLTPRAKPKPQREGAERDIGRLRATPNNSLVSKKGDRPDDYAIRRASTQERRDRARYPTPQTRTKQRSNLGRPLPDLGLGRRFGFTFHRLGNQPCALVVRQI